MENVSVSNSLKYWVMRLILHLIIFFLHLHYVKCVFVFRRVHSAVLIHLSIYLTRLFGLFV